MARRIIHAPVSGYGTVGFLSSSLSTDQRSQIATYWNHLKNDVLKGGDSDGIRWRQYEHIHFSGTAVSYDPNTGQERYEDFEGYLETDPEVLYEWDSAGEFDFDDIYSGSEQ